MAEPTATAEATARQKHDCPACGAAANWNPAKQALVCPYCGTVAPGTLAPEGEGGEGGEIVEHDLVAALRGIPDSARGWQAPKTEVKCQSCAAISVFDPTRVAQRCDFCGSASLIPYEEVKDAFRPESVLPMKVSETEARDAIRKWYGAVWFAPNNLKKRALTDQVKGIYLPYWTFDAQVHADWTADAGFYYYETEFFKDSEGKTQTRQVQRTRWEPASGALDHFFDDELVPASKGVPPERLAAIEPFPTTGELKPYDPAFVSGWVVERYQIDLVAAAQRARGTMDAKLRNLCSAEVPGDTQRNLNVMADYSGQTFKHVLVPVWLLNYHYGSRNFQVVMNGYTGKVTGEYPKSWIKMTLAVLATLIVIAIFIALWVQAQ